MKMGIDRGILRWDIRASMLTARLRQVEGALASLEANPPGDGNGARDHTERLRSLARERNDLMRALAALGPSPRAKMG
ncbi:MAG TPA: hypothetical protein VJN88_08250 [Ktedonobacterales bacterium]|nr:hypothetical protein [Ktedonobacterales bacterium]